MKDWKKELNDMFIKAMKDGDKVKTGVLKMLKTDLTNEEIKNNREELKEEQVDTVIQRAAKKRREAMEEFRKVDKMDRVKEEEDELKVLQEFLPEQMDEKEVEKVIDETIKAVGAEDMKDLGKVMGAAMGKLKGKADGKLIQELVKQKLS